MKHRQIDNPDYLRAQLTRASAELSEFIAALVVPASLEEKRRLDELNAEVRRLKQQLDRVTTA